MRARAAESVLEGKKLTPSLLAEAAAAAAAEAKPVSDLRASADYRREMTEVLVRRALRHAQQRAVR
jgi:carbon-monoxide dehydrogenase medium subunit